MTRLSHVVRPLLSFNPGIARKPRLKRAVDGSVVEAALAL